MIKPEEVMNIRSLIKQGYSYRAISRMVGVDRRVVKKYAEQGVLPVYKNINRASQLDIYKPLIKGWLAQEDYQATKIHELLVLEGFKGSYDIVRRYVYTLKQERDRVAYVRFETTPGKQAQVDFGDFKIINTDGSESTIYCFVMSLGYSRHKYVEFIDQCTMPKFLACHQHAFGFFGGIPCEIMYDNMKNVVIKRFAGKVEWNKTFEAFAVHYGFKPIATPPYSPWVKGKVERPYQYIQERFWRGYVFSDIEQANQDIHHWLRNVAMERLHGTTKEKVSVRFHREKSYLGSLPRNSYDISDKFIRKVHKDCQISFNGNYYVMPHEYVGKKVLLRIREGVMRAWYNDQLIAVYCLSTGKGETKADPRFYHRLRHDQTQIQRKYRKPYGKAKATRGLVQSSWDVKVFNRSLSDYDQLIPGGLSHE